MTTITKEAKEIGAYLRRARERAGRTQEWLAGQCGWTDADGRANQTRTSQYETGRRRITGVELKKAAEALGITLGELFSDDSPRLQSSQPVTPKEKEMLALWERLPQSAKAAWEDMLQQPEPMISMFAGIYWPMKTSFDKLKSGHFYQVDADFTVTAADSEPKNNTQR